MRKHTVIEPGGFRALVNEDAWQCIETIICEKVKRFKKRLSEEKIDPSDDIAVQGEIMLRIEEYLKLSCLHPKSITIQSFGGWKSAIFSKTPNPMQ